MRLILVPQYPTKNRYSEFWYTEFPKNLKKYFDEIIVLGKNKINLGNTIEKRDPSMFSLVNEAILFEQEQIKEYMNLKIKNEDFLLSLDMSFPGFFSNVLYHKPINNSYTYLHASSKNNYDYFKSVRYSKFPSEIAQSRLFKKVFVGSLYHKLKLKWKNTKVLGVPYPNFKVFKENKKYNIISVSRPSVQKITKKIETKIEKDFEKIIRKNCDNWGEYYKFLSEAKVVLLSGKEETFGYQVLEAIINNSIPLAPNKFSYPELLPREYLYNDYDELELKIKYYLEKYNEVPKLLNRDLCEKFYDNLAKEMLE